MFNFMKDVLLPGLNRRDTEGIARVHSHMRVRS